MMKHAGLSALLLSCLSMFVGMAGEKPDCQYVMPQIVFRALEERIEDMTFTGDTLRLRLRGEGSFQAPSLQHYGQTSSPFYMLTAQNEASYPLGDGKRVTLRIVSRASRDLAEYFDYILPWDASCALRVQFDNAGVKHVIFLFPYCPHERVQKLLTDIRGLPGTKRKGVFVGKWGRFVVAESHPFYPPYWVAPEQTELPETGMAIDALGIIFANLGVVEYSPECKVKRFHGRPFGVEYQLQGDTMDTTLSLAMDSEAATQPLQFYRRCWLAVLPIRDIGERCQYRDDAQSSGKGIDGGFRRPVCQTMREDLLDQLIRRLLLPKNRNVALLVLDGGGGERGDLRSDRFYDKHYVIRICQPFVLAYLSADELSRAEAIAKSGRVSLKRHGGCWLLTLPQYWEYWAPTSLNPADWPVKPAKMERHLPNGKVETLNQ